MNYELFGLPGSGKTTICKIVSKKNKNPMFFYKETFLGKILFHLFLYTFFFKKEYIELFYNLKKSLKNKKYVNIIDKRIPIDLYLKYIVFVYYLECSNKNIIIDEGIIHYCVALIAEFNVSNYEIENMIKFLDTKTIIYGLNTTIDSVCINIKKRNRRNCPFDYLSNEKKIEVLKKYNYAIEYFKNRYKMMNAEEIIEIILNGGNDI